MPEKSIDWVRRLCLPRSFPCRVGTPGEEGVSLPSALDYAERHGLMPLLLHGISKIDSSVSPVRFLLPGKSCPWIDPESAKRIQGGYLSALRANMEKLNQLEEIHCILQAMKIQGILWKGAALIHDVYRDPGMRPMDDIDLLVDRKHLSATMEALKRIGFRQMHNYPMVWQKKGTLVDLHVDVMHSDRIASRKHFFPLTIEEMQTQIRRLPDRTHLAVPSPFDMLLLSAVHALKHDFSRDIWIADAFYVVNRYVELVESQGVLFRRAARFNAVMPMDILLQRMKNWHSGVAIDTTVYRQATRTGPIAGKLVRSLRREKQLPGAGELLTALMIPSVGKRLRFFLETAFPRQHVMQQLFGHRQTSSRWKLFPKRIGSLLQIIFNLAKSMR